MSDLTSDMVRQIDGVLAAARDEGRHSLYEHEVYRILSTIGLDAPRFLFVRDPAEVTAGKLSGFGHTVVAKIVSPAIPHKQKIGGVKKAPTADPLFVQFVLERMRQEVLSHFSPGEAPALAGFLLVEYVPHTQALGFEVLVGFREDPAFGPVLTVSKGGDDAEFFAANYDPANLFLPPMDYSAALDLMRSLHIRNKFESIGHPEYLELMARAVAGMSMLAYHYSPIAASPGFILTALEVNPFAISKDHRFVALDGLAEFRTASDADAWVPGANAEGLDALFRPRGVAVIGVSSDLSKYSLGRDIAELLSDLDRDDLFLINPRGGTLRFGQREYALYGGISKLPAPVELAVYAAPAQNAPDFLRSLQGTAVKAVILIPGIPASMRYADYAARLREAVPPGVRVLGPNCMGVFWTPGSGARDIAAPAAPDAAPAAKGINTLFINEKRLEVRASERADAVLLTQSGALAVTVLDKLKSSGPLRSVVSFGNKFDVNLSDLMAYFERDPSIRVVAIYVEGFDPGEGRRFYDMAVGMGKPIVAYKGGRTEAGARSAASHTASMSGSYDVFQAACRQAGVIPAKTMEEYYDLVKTFSLLASRPPSGNRVAGVVNAGFESTVGADELAGLRQAALSAATLARLNEINRSGLVDTSTPFLDVTPMADDRQYADYVEAVMRDPGVDCVFVAIVPHAVTLKTIPETCREPDGLAGLLVSLASRSSKPMVVSVNAGRHYGDFVSVLEEGGLPVYADIRSAISSLDTFVSYNLARRAGS
jgi:3-hydroxypropionyl-CoA synthetase (ADP-forming)